jgi:BASS family bile acid:Na+ symporter
LETLEVIFDRVIPVVLFILMLGMGLTLRIADFKRLFLQPKPVLIGLIGQLFLLPLLAFALIHLLGAPPDLAVGAMLLAACPGGVTSNGYVFVSRGDVGLSVTLTAITSIATIVTIPLITVFSMGYFYSSEAQVTGLPVTSIMQRLVTVTALPICIGMALMHRLPQYRERAAELARKASLFFLILIIVGITLSTLETLKEHLLSTAALAISLNVIALAMGYAIAKLAKLSVLQIRTVTFEVGVQNLSLAVLVSFSILHRPELAVFSFVYALFMKITSLILVYRWRASNQVLMAQR